MSNDPEFQGLVDYAEVPDKLRGERSKIGQRGKVAEGIVQRRLQALAQSAGKAFYRLPDFRAGSMQPTLADFLYFENKETTVIEVKEVNHDYRLPFSNFDAAQVARMRVLELAGVNAIVLVYHSSNKTWRKIPVGFFVTRGTKAGSWVLSEFPAFNRIEEVL